MEYDPNIFYLISKPHRVHKDYFIQVGKTIVENIAFLDPGEYAFDYGIVFFQYHEYSQIFDIEDTQMLIDERNLLHLNNLANQRETEFLVQWIIYKLESRSIEKKELDINRIQNFVDSAISEAKRNDSSGFTFSLSFSLDYMEAFVLPTEYKAKKVFWIIFPIIVILFMIGYGIFWLLTL